MVNQLGVVANGKDRDHLKSTLLLIAAIWLIGLTGHFTLFKEWGALALYIIGSIALALWRGARFGEWRKLYITGTGLKPTLLWGGILGVVVSLISLTNIPLMHTAGPSEMQMQAMVEILLGYKLILLFPLLIVAEEFLWRGLLLSSLVGRGISSGAAIGLTTLCFMLNHFAVAPVGLLERGMMALMGLPLGIINGFLTLKTQNLWGGVLIHLLTMLAMVLGIFLM